MKSEKNWANRANERARADAAFDRFWNRVWIGMVVLAFGACIALLIFGSGCARTVAPKLVSSSQASWDGAEQNSGVLGHDAQNNYFLTPHARDRYNALIALYGGRFQPALRPDQGISATSSNTFLLSPEGVGHFSKMNAWRRNEKPAWGK